MSVPAGPARARPDACPGALTTHRADDGELARVRLPGGAIDADQLRELARAADDLGDGHLHLTSRGNVQLRGLNSGTELAARLAAAGLLPSADHERVRNILASPWSGLSGGVADVRELAPALDRALCARPELAELPGRFMFGFDDGRGDIVDDRIDVCWRATSSDAGTLVLAGMDSGVVLTRQRAVDALIAAAETFLLVRGSSWQVRELDASQRAAVVDGVRHMALSATSPEPSGQLDRPPLCGVVRLSGDRAVVAVGALFGVLTSAQVRLIADLVPSAVLTPWRTVLLPGLTAARAEDAERVLVEAGLLLDPDAEGLRISACIGRPGCAKSLADVRRDAMRAMSELAASPGAGAVRAHFSGCARRCGRPRDGAADVLADGTGYVVDGEPIAAERVAESLVSLAWKGNE